MKLLMIVIVPLFYVFFISCTSVKTTSISNSIAVNDSTGIDQTEVDVYTWLSYYTWKLLNEGFEEAQKVLPDSTCTEPYIWEYIKNPSPNFSNSINYNTRQPLGYFPDKCKDIEKTGIIPRSNNLTTKCAILFFPITGLTYEQVINFCKWRTEIAGLGLFEFRLPTEKEWKDFIKLGLSPKEMQLGLKDSTFSEGKCKAFNYLNNTTCDTNNISINSVLESSVSNLPDSKNLYNTFGNVSEMTMEKGVSKGGNFLLYAKQCHLDSIQAYEKPEKWLGFRCLITTKPH